MRGANLVKTSILGRILFSFSVVSANPFGHRSGIKAEEGIPLLLCGVLKLRNLGVGVFGLCGEGLGKMTKTEMSFCNCNRSK